MNSYIVHPKNKTEEKAVKAFFESLDIAFERLNAPFKKKAALPVKAMSKIKPIKNLNSYAANELKEETQENVVLPLKVKELLQKSIEQIDKGEFYNYENVKQIFK